MYEHKYQHFLIIYNYRTQDKRFVIILSTKKILTYSILF
jgi:hypothetical protein